MIYFIAVALISTATIILELALLRLFAVQQFYHFAFMAVSLALLGAGASGSLLTVWRRRFSPLLLCLLFGLSTIGAYLVLNYLPFDSFSIAWDRRQVFFLGIYFLVAAVPFLFSGLVIGGELMHPGGATAKGSTSQTGSHQVYSANLIGSSLGALAAIGLLSIFSGVGVVITAAVLGAIAGLLFGILDLRASPRTPSVWLGMMLICLLVGAGGWIILNPPDLFDQQLSPYKTLSILSQTKDARLTLSESDASARVDVIESGIIHVMPGLSLMSPVQPPVQAGLMLDGDSLMPITNLDPDSDQARQLAEHMPNGLIYRLRPGASTLVLGSGTGMDVLLSLASGAPHVTAVEENDLVLRTLEAEYREFTHDLYRDPRTSIVNQSSRVFARQRAASEQGTNFPVVILALTEPHRPVTSGAFSLTEDYLHTVEAFEDYLKLLDEGGLLAVTRWLQAPPSESGRTFGILVESLQNRDLDPAAHIIAFRTLRTMTFLTSLQPFTGDELAAVREFLAERNYDPVYFPGVTVDELNQHNVLEEPLYHDLFTEILSDPQAAYDESRFNIEPPTDDKPFFYHYFKWRQTPEILAGLGYNWQPFGGSGYFVLVALLIVVLLASAVLILSPLLLRRLLWREERLNRRADEIPRWRLRVFLYFSALGLAFLFIEIPLAQRFILLLDQPVTALAAVLFAILLFSGLGSLTVRRWSTYRALPLLIALIIFLPFLLKPLSEVALNLPQWRRIIFAVLIVAPLGFLMGFPFAGGLRVVEDRDPSLVPWAWAINGVFSVVSSVLAVMVALSWGFPAVFWLGALAYGIALLSFRRFWIGGKRTARIT